MSLHSEVGHSGSTVYSNAAASGERDGRERGRGTHGENTGERKRYREKQQEESAHTEMCSPVRYFCLHQYLDTKEETCAYTHTPTIFRITITAGVKVCLYDGISLMGILLTARKHTLYRPHIVGSFYYSDPQFNH